MTEAETTGGSLLGRMLGPYGVLRGKRSLALLFGGQVVSAFGDWLYILALAILAFDLTGSARLWIAYPLVFATTALSSLFKPAVNSVLPGVVGDEEKLVQANSIWSQMEALSIVLGPTLGGVLALLGVLRLAFLINGATFLVSAATLLFVRIPPREATQEAGEGGEEPSGRSRSFWPRKPSGWVVRGPVS